MPKPIEGAKVHIAPIDADPTDESQWVDVGFTDAIAFDEEPGDLPAWPQYAVDLTTELTVTVTSVITQFFEILGGWANGLQAFMRLFAAPVSRKTETPARSAMHAAYRAKTRNRRRRRR